MVVGTVTLTRTARVSVCAGRITVSSSQAGDGTRLTTAVRDAAPPAGHVMRARVTVR